MRLALTVVSPGTRRTADVVLEADPATPVGRVAGEIGRFIGADLTTPGMYVASQRVPHQLTLLESPIRDGTVVSLGSPEGCVEPEPGGLVEIRVMSGPGAGSVYWLPAGTGEIRRGGTAG